MPPYRTGSFAKLTPRSATRGASEAAVQLPEGLRYRTPHPPLLGARHRCGYLAVARTRWVADVAFTWIWVSLLHPTTILRIPTIRLIHRSAWTADFASFASIGFSELCGWGFLRSWAHSSQHAILLRFSLPERGGRWHPLTNEDIGSSSNEPPAPSAGQTIQTP
jgi:hypothetical protein